MPERTIENPNGSKHIVITNDEGDIIQDIMTAPPVQIQTHPDEKEGSLDYALAAGLLQHRHHRR